MPNHKLSKNVVIKISVGSSVDHNVAYKLSLFMYIIFCKILTITKDHFPQQH
jgi:hypothetical protein